MWNKKLAEMSPLKLDALPLISAGQISPQEMNK